MTLTTRELVTVVGLTAALVIGVLVVADRVLDDNLPHHREMRDLLADLRDRDVDGRVVVLGTSLDRNGFGTHAELGDALSSEDFRVGAVNLGMGAAGWQTFEPILDALWNAQPDVVIVQPSTFRPQVRTDDTSLRARVRRWSNPVPSRSINEIRCVAKTEERLELTVQRNLDRFATTVPHVEEAVDLVREAAARGVDVVLYFPPRSRPVEAAIAAAGERWRAPLVEALAGEPNVTGPLRPAVGLDDDAFCDWAHVGETGREAILDEIVPVIRSVLAADGASE